MAGLSHVPRVRPALVRIAAADVAVFREATTALQRAQVEAEALLARAHAEAEQIRQRAFDCGRALACSATAAEMLRLSHALSAETERAHELLESVIFKLLHRLLLDEFDAAALGPRLRRLIRQEIDEPIVAVRVAPGRVEWAKTEVASLAATGSRRPLVLADATLAESDAILETPLGSVSCALGDQLAALERAFAQNRSLGDPDAAG